LLLDSLPRRVVGRSVRSHLGKELSIAAVDRVLLEGGAPKTFSITATENATTLTTTIKKLRGNHPTVSMSGKRDD
jgi:hypothetical protein